MKLYASLIDRLSTQHEAIPIIISKIDSDRLLIKPQPDKWNIKDNIAHLTRYQQVFTDRVNQILHNNNPSFERYRAEEDPEFEKWRSLTIEKLTETLNSDRKILFNLISELKDHEIDRIGTHRKYGALTISQWIEFFLLHEAHHIFTIFQLSNDTEL